MAARWVPGALRLGGLVVLAGAVVVTAVRHRLVRLGRVASPAVRAAGRDGAREPPDRGP
ncbi:hypothetical protein ACWCYZ_38770 [Streptomyces virginiae]